MGEEDPHLHRKSSDAYTSTLMKNGGGGNRWFNQDHRRGGSSSTTVRRTAVAVLDAISIPAILYNNIHHLINYA